MLTEKTKRNIFIILVILITSFLIFNFRVFFLSPEVKIYDFESSDTLVTKDNEYILKGKAKGSKNLYINNKEVLLNTEEEFSQKLYLFDYQNTFNIKSTSKTGTVFRRIIYIYKI